MKTTFKIFAGLFLLTLLMACEDDLLTVTNPNARTPETFWQSESDAQAALATVYSALQFNAVCGVFTTQEIARSDMAGTNYWVDKIKPFSDYSISNNNDYVYRRWAELYVGINRANQVINNVQEMDEDLFTGDNKNLIIAQARFLRAFFYFRVVHSYGEAVITLKASGLDEDIYIGLSDMQTVNDTVIIPDLEYAISYLPTMWDNSDLGRVTWGAATAMLGKVYLFNQDWNMAAILFKEIIDSGIYGLTANYGDNFRHDTEYNGESIFEVAFETVSNPAGSGQNHDDVYWDGGGTAGGEATAIANWFAIWGAGGWSNTLPTYWLHELFLADVSNQSGVHSARLKASIAINPKGHDGEGLLYGLSYDNMADVNPKCWDENNGEISYVKKYTNYYWASNEDPNERSQINHREIRYADVLLMYAEAILERDGDGAATEALAIIDIIRARAGVMTLSDYMSSSWPAGNFPQLHISKQLNSNHPFVPPTAENLLTHLKWVERPLELAFEGHRFKDLVRWGMVREVLDFQHEAEEARYELYADENGKCSGLIAPLYIGGSFRRDFLNNWQVYTPTTHDYWPIPSDELQNNTAIGNN